MLIGCNLLFALVTVKGVVLGVFGSTSEQCCSAHDSFSWCFAFTLKLIGESAFLKGLCTAVFDSQFGEDARELTKVAFSSDGSSTTI